MGVGGFSGLVLTLMAIKVFFLKLGRIVHGSLNFKVFLLQIKLQYRTDDNVINYVAFLQLFHLLIYPFTTLRLLSEGKTSA
jgi:hypothetical protein